MLRDAEHKALKTLELSGSILDLGGDARSEYRVLIQGNHTYTTVNLDERASPDILHDLEKSLPVADASYDHAVLINVLEHVYGYQQLLQEAVRAIRSEGKIIIVVPFLFPVHPSPSDYWRFTDATLLRMCETVGLSVLRVVPLGTGVFSARYVMLDRLLPTPIRFLFTIVLRPFVSTVDRVFAATGRVLGKKYATSDYALGYLVEARKN